MQVSVCQQNKQTSMAPSAAKSTGTKAKRKSRWKLKFHHQALPPEYLDHYEASLQKGNECGSPHSQVVQCSNAEAAGPVPDPKMPAHSQVSSSAPLQSPPSWQSTVKFKDLPYMGEMTLDNARPRRGRKPKKADICHLIYKNYGTTVVEEPLNLCLRDLQNNDGAANQVSMCKFKFTGGTTPSLQERKSLYLNSSGSLKMLDKHHSRNRELKRKSRKSLAREKLEKTFKERGFLIQTQQLESAQGATYCKFRQLRKFTRYLFRSWKHHLPGDIINNNNNNNNNNAV